MKSKNSKKKKNYSIVLGFSIVLVLFILLFLLFAFYFSSFPQSSPQEKGSPFTLEESQTPLNITRILATVPNLQRLKPMYPKTYLYYNLKLLHKTTPALAQFLEQQLRIHAEELFQQSLPGEGIFFSNITLYQPSRTILTNTTELENPLVHKHLLPLLTHAEDVFFLHVNWQRRIIKSYSLIQQNESINHSFFEQIVPDEQLVRYLFAMALPSVHPPLNQSLQAFHQRYGNLTQTNAWIADEWLYFEVDFPEVLFPKIFRDQGALN